MNSKRGPWTVLSQSVAYDNRWITVTHHDVRTPSQTAGIYGTVHFKNWAIGVVPVDDDGYTYLVGQHRFPLDNYSWEIPEGGGPLDVDVAVSAARELKEETGLSAAHWQKLVESELSNSVSDERAIAFLAWGLSAGAAQPDPTEQLEVRRLPLSAAFAMAEAGEIRDALSLLALQSARLLHLGGRLPVRCA
jgi:8-oxo-dGTP pyrophosphatase MutT (NUDIX family)